MLYNLFFFLNPFSLVYYLGDKENNIAFLIDKNVKQAYGCEGMSSKEERL